ncbi:hypothetical protein J3L18_26655 [Mucilaginibacter gossypii]|uniref:hypothetical protein n=1 Tax=Mucilaginibacter gossypii TaxID=551996 RepID=UPI000DCC7050|nr:MULTISPECIES: hypothetical protein [Mucilaginibacter]QTE36667.1 hypothetical protein J3L18_26655 [Mucilaginibacter gossypii]RAV55508.1 hypothetical protein DIU36_17115 [Mucilaginibacter rubeus]
MSLGKIAYKYFFKPTFSIRYHISHFGLKGWLNMQRGEQQMKKAALKFPPLSLSKQKILNVSFLTGAKYWHQTIFCAYTLAHFSDGEIGIRLYSDGTLTDEQIGFINQVLPGIETISEQQVLQHLNLVLPQHTFPTLRHLRNWHPFFRRLIDIHTSPSWAIHMDSDMIFFGKPNQIIEAYQRKTAVYMKEQLASSYFVDSEDTLKDKYGINCIKSVNGGIIAYDNARVDYTDLEEKAKLLLQHYPQAGPAQVEQTLMSYMLHHQNAAALDEKSYSIFYDDKPDLSRPNIVRHYIFKAKLPYLTSEWKKVIL